MKKAAFYFLLSAPIVVWAAIVLPNYVLDNSSISSTIVYYAVTISPMIGGDVSLFGELTPTVLAAGIIALVPTQNRDINLVAVALAILAYVLFVHLSVYFSSGPGVGLLSINWSDIAAPQKTFLTLISNIRVMAIVIAASIVGFKMKNTT